jgi:hypothetical protein
MPVSGLQTTDPLTLVMTPAGPGNGLTSTGIAEGVPKLQRALNPFTVKLPDTAEDENTHVIWFVVAPFTIVTPAGTVHSYKVALATGVIE